MLVLSRRVGERLFIGNDIVVTIIDVRSDGVRVGIDAPREIRVTRAEIFEAVEKRDVEAASADDSAPEKAQGPRPQVGALAGARTSARARNGSAEHLEVLPPRPEPRPQGAFAARSGHGGVIAHSGPIFADGMRDETAGRRT